MFGVSFTEITVIALVALIVVGPEKLPKMLYTLGQWVGKLRRLTTEVRAQTGIDDILRQEGFEGGLRELRGLLRGDIAVGRAARDVRDYDYPAHDPYEDAIELDRTREYPIEGADADGALPDDLVDDEPLDPAPESAPRAEELFDSGQAPPWAKPEKAMPAAPAADHAEPTASGPPKPEPHA